MKELFILYPVIPEDQFQAYYKKIDGTLGAAK